MELYELAACGESAGWRQRRDAYETALGHFEQGRWSEALAALEQVCQEQSLPLDGPSSALREYIQSLAQPPCGAFDGVWAFEHK